MATYRASELVGQVRRRGLCTERAQGACVCENGWRGGWGMCMYVVRPRALGEITSINRGL